MLSNHTVFKVKEKLQPVKIVSRYCTDNINCKMVMDRKAPHTLHTLLSCHVCVSSVGLGSNWVAKDNAAIIPF